MNRSIAWPSLWRTAFALIIASEGATAHATRSSVRPRPHGQVFPRDCRRCEHCARVCRAAGFLRHRAQRPQRGDLHCRHFPRTPHVEPARRHVFGPGAIRQASRMLIDSDHPTGWSDRPGWASPVSETSDRSWRDIQAILALIDGTGDRSRSPGFAGAIFDVRALLTPALAAERMIRISSNGFSCRNACLTENAPT